MRVLRGGSWSCRRWQIMQSACGNCPIQLKRCKKVKGQGSAQRLPRFVTITPSRSRPGKESWPSCSIKRL